MKQESITQSRSPHQCLPCKIPPFCRNNYFTGKLLTERDFISEQHYLVDKLRLHHVALHGWGIVCGLRVKAHPHCPQLRIVVTPGLAIDGCGREVRVLDRVELELPRPSTPKPENADPCPPEPETQQPVQLETEQSEAEEEEQPCQPQDELRTLYICLRYAECETELMPAPFDECACGTNGKKPNRICERFELEILDKEPPVFKHLREENERCETDECESLYRKLTAECAEPRAHECIPLAVIRNYKDGAAVTHEMIDNWTFRRLLPSVTVLDRLIRCILDKLPTCAPTNIVDIGWPHRGDYHCHDFMRTFIGNADSPKGFEVTFSAPVRTEGLTRRTFQAIAVRYSDKTFGAGHPEIAPAKVRWNTERTKVYLDIDPLYARERLDRSSFDLYLLLRCNLIVDDHGNPVDGELLAKLDEDHNYITGPPTGDGVPGGLFESWIRVHHGEQH
jgi:hypothetical protein